MQNVENPEASEVPVEPYAGAQLESGVRTSDPHAQMATAVELAVVGVGAQACKAETQLEHAEVAFPFAISFATFVARDIKPCTSERLLSPPPPPSRVCRLSNEFA